MLDNPYTLLGIDGSASLPDAREALVKKAQAYLSLTAQGDTEASAELGKLQNAYAEIKRRLTKGKLHDEIQGHSPAHVAVIEVCQNVLSNIYTVEEYWLDFKGIKIPGSDQGMKSPEFFYSDKIAPEQRQAFIDIHRVMSFSLTPIIGDLDRVFDHAKRDRKIDGLNRDSFEKVQFADERGTGRPYFGLLAKDMIKFIASIDPVSGPQGAQVSMDESYKRDSNLVIYYALAIEAIYRLKNVFGPDIRDTLELGPPRSSEVVRTLQLGALTV